MTPSSGLFLHAVARPAAHPLDSANPSSSLSASYLGTNSAHSCSSGPTPGLRLEKLGCIRRADPSQMQTTVFILLSRPVGQLCNHMD